MTSPRPLKRPRPPPPRAILALDLDCFYASVAIRARPHLADKPVVIVQKHLCVTSNYVARTRASGAVQKMTPVSKALAACPDLVLIDGSDLTPFRAASLEVLSVIRAWLRARVARHPAAPPPRCACQRLGFDEVFIDLSELVAREIAAGGMPWGFEGHVVGRTEDDHVRRTLMVASQLAHQLRAHVLESTRLTLCAGIGHSKLLAKLAVNMNKPNDQTTFLPGDAPEYVARLSPRSLPGFGYGFNEKISEWSRLHAAGRKPERVRDVLAMFGNGREGFHELATVLGSEATARHILALCRAEDESRVVDRGDAPKSISSEDSCRSCSTMQDLHRRITTQTARLVSRLRQDGELYSRRPRTLTISYRFRGDGYFGTSRSVPMPMEIVSVCCSKHPRAEETAVGAIRRTAFAVLKEHAGVCDSSSFDLTLFAVGASNFTDKDQATADQSLQKVTDFFKPRENNSTPSDAAVSQRAPVPRVEANSLGKGTPPLAPPKHSGTPSKKANKNEGQSVCPVCSNRLPTDNAQINRHIDKCLQPFNEKPLSKKRRTVSRTTRVDSFFRRA